MHHDEDSKHSDVLRLARRLRPEHARRTAALIRLVAALRHAGSMAAELDAAIGPAVSEPLRRLAADANYLRLQLEYADELIGVDLNDLDEEEADAEQARLAGQPASGDVAPSFVINS